MLKQVMVGHCTCALEKIFETVSSLKRVKMVAGKLILNSGETNEGDGNSKIRTRETD